MFNNVAELESNAGILRYLADGADPWSVRIDRPSAETDTWRLGAHPDVVERLWIELDAALPTDTRYLVAGGAALAHPDSGAILALALGTRYALRLTSDAIGEAMARGYETRHEFRTVARTLDLAAVFGSGWVFGRGGAEEARWLADTYAAVSGE